MNQEELNAQLEAATNAYQDRNIDTAEMLCKRILDVNPKEPTALYILGCIYKDLGRYQEAEQMILASIRLGNTSHIAYLNIAQVYGASGQYGRAIEILKEALSEHSKIPELWFLFGVCFFLSGQKEKAVMAYRNVIGLDPSIINAYKNLAIALKEIGEVDEAIACCRKAIEVKPDYAEAYSQLGILLIECGKMDEAIASCRKAIEVKPDYAEAYSQLGILLNDCGKIDEAIASYRKAIEVKPDYAEVYISLGIILNECGKMDEATTHYRKAIEVNPNFVDALFLLASQLKSSGEYEEAICFFKRALAQDANHVNSRAGLGWSYLESGQLEEAVEYYSNLLQSSPGEIDDYFYLFESLRGDLHDKLNHNFSYSHYFLGQCLELLGASKIVAFGDSHVNLFKGCDEIEVNHVGASTAYGLSKEDSSTGGRRKVLNRISSMDSDHEAVLLCFGEVDIRANVIRQCYLKGISIEDCVNDIVTRYVLFASEIASHGFRLLIYGGYGAGADRNAFGSDKERNYAAMYLNSCLEARMHSEWIFVFFSS